MYDNLLMYESQDKLAQDIKDAVMDYPQDGDDARIMDDLAKASDKIAEYIWKRKHKLD